MAPDGRARTLVAESSPTTDLVGGGPPAGRSSFALALILAVAFIVVLDFSIVNVALASIERELHVRAADVQWVITAYAITFGGLLVLGGRVADLFGRRRVLVTGLVLFSLASLAGGLSGTIAALVAARAVQGIGAALIAPAALSLITTTTREGAPRHRALGLYGATASIGFVAGLVLGGVLVQYFDWRSVLWVNVPIGLLAAALAPLLLPESRAPHAPRLDPVGALLVTASIAALVYGVSLGPTDGWLAPPPLVRLGLLGVRPVRTANAFTLAVGAWSAAELLIVPLYLQLVLHESPLVTGLAVAPQGIVGFLAASRGPATVRRLGARRLLVVAASAAVLGLLTLAGALGTHEYPLLLVGLLLAGYGTATAMFGSTVVATSGVADDEQGLASGLVTMTRQVGAAVGVAIAAAIVGTSGVAGASAGSDALALCLAGLVAVAGALVVGRGLAGTGERPVRDRAQAGAPEPASRRLAAARPTVACASACRDA